ncbi:MAG: DNA polymerase III subunit gamma/tau, partial [Butyrivibrio sp.]|nr:DNA polymerase III subunit gamma/tau [Butyrivibrio sp.]
MSYVALYRKFRPPVFEDVKGQDHIVTTLKNQIKSDRIGHAYLFCGTRGTGKTSVAKIFAKAVNCEHPVDGSPCGECETCKAIASGASMNVIEIDAASNNGVDNIREIVDEVSYSPTRGKYKVYIIDEVHMLSTGAFNALLKTLEEPPSYVIFILATTEVQKIPITILSRCQRYDFHRITAQIIEDRLTEVTKSEGVAVEERALRYIAKAADGSMRDSLSLLDQCIAFNYGQELTYDKVLSVLGAVDTEVFGKLFSYLIEQNVSGVLTLLSDIVIQGRELTQFVSDFVWYLRNMMLVMSSDQMEDVVDISTENLKEMKSQAQSANIDTIMRYISIFSDLSSQIKFSPQKRVLIEMTLIRLCIPQMDNDDSALKDRIRILEDHDKQTNEVIKGIKSGSIAVAAASGTATPKEEPPKIKKLEMAVPKEIEYVVNNWKQIMANVHPMKRQFLQHARISLGNEGQLLIVLGNKERVDYFNEKDNQDEMKAVIADVIHKDVNIEARYLEETQKFEENYVDLNMINFDIVTEDSVKPPVNEADDKEQASETETTGPNENQSSKVETSGQTEIQSSEAETTGQTESLAFVEGDNSGSEDNKNETAGTHIKEIDSVIQNSNVESKEDILNDNDSEISRAPFMDDDYEEDISPEQLDDLMAFSHEM